MREGVGRERPERQTPEHDGDARLVLDLRPSSHALHLPRRRRAGRHSSVADADRRNRRFFRLVSRHPVDALRVLRLEQDDWDLFRRKGSPLLAAGARHRAAERDADL